MNNIITLEKQVQKINKKTQKVNEAFESASPEQKRVMLAKDALSQLGKTTEASAQRFITFHGIHTRVKKGDELQKVLPKIDLCGVCALGSLFVSQVRMANNCKLSAGEITCGMVFMEKRVKQMEKYFSKEQLHLIEYAFEGGAGLYRTSEYSDNAMEFYNKHTSDKKRMVAILKNIIRNKGTFIP